MPGNELGDGFHNFFMRDTPFQGQQQPHVAEGNWPSLNSSFLGGAGSGEHPFFLSHGSPLIQSGPRPSSANGSDEQPIMNGLVHDNQSHQPKQNAANSDQRHFTSSRGFSFHQLQQRGPEHILNASVSTEASASPLSFDLFGGQHQLAHQQPNIPHFLQPRQSGINETPPLQRQLVIRKFQEEELQMQQLDSRQDFTTSKVPPPFARPSSGSQSTLVNATSNSNNFLQNPLSTEYDANWLHQSPPIMQGSSNGHAFQLNTGQSTCSVNLIPHHFDQSLYGFPVPNSRGLPETYYPQIMADRYLMPQPQLSIASSSSLQGNQSNSLTDHVGTPDESSTLRHNFQSQTNLEFASKQSVNAGMKGGVVNQQVNSLSRNVAQQAFRGKQQLSFPMETTAKSMGQVSSPKNESALDPEEEKILFGSDDNIWSAFGNVPPHIGGESGKMIGNVGLFDGLPSIQSGSWSALMQSVAETSSNDAILQERSSITFHNNDNGRFARQMSSMHNDRDEKVKSSSENNVRMHSALNPGSFTVDNVETANVMVLNQPGSTIQQEHGRGVHTETSYNFVLPSKEDRYHFCSNPLRTSVASQHDNQPERDANTTTSEQTGTRVHSSWNNLATMPPSMDRFNNHDSQRLKQCSQNSQDNLMRGKTSSSREQNPLLSRSNESVRVKSEVFNPGSRGVDDASVAHANNTKKTSNTGPSRQTSSLFNQWRSAVSPATSRDSKSSDSLLNQTNKHNQISDLMIIHNEDDAAKREEEKYAKKNNTSDIRYSNLSHHMSHDFRESGSSSTNDPRSPTPAKQKPINQFYNKDSVSRKFLYHPMVNVDEDVEANNMLRRPVAVRASQQTHFSESNLFGQVASNSMAAAKGQSFELPRDGEDAGNESLNKNPSRLALNFSASVSQATDTSQNMLELLHKVDQKKDHAGTTQIIPKGNAPSQPPDSNNYNVHHLQSQSSVSQGFGLHLGPPSERMQISQNSEGRPSVPFFTVDGPATFENSRSENSLHKMPGNVSSGLIAGIPSSKGRLSHLHDEKSSKPGINKSINQYNDPLSGNSSQNTQRGSIETRLPDVSTSDRQDNLAASNVPEQIGNDDFLGKIPSSTVPLKDYEGTSQHFAMPGNSQQRDYSAKMPFNIWSNVSMHHNSGQRLLVPSQISGSTCHNILQSSSSPMQRLEAKSKESFGQQSESVSVDCLPEIEESIGKEYAMKNHLDNYLSNSTSVLKEIEDFGRYLRPNSFSDQTDSLPKQTQSLKDKSLDSSITDRQDNIAGATPSSGKAGNQGSSTAVISADSKMVSSSEPVHVPRIIPQCGSITSQKDSGLNPGFSQSHMHGDSANFPRGEQHQVSPQMAPTWFSLHGSSKSGQMLIHNARELSQVRTGEPPLPLGKSTIGLNAPNAEEKGTDATPSASIANLHCSSSLPQLNVTGQNLVPLRQKRKSATFEPQPWHKEIVDDSRFLGILSTAEPDLSKIANRVDGVVETTEDANPALRSKRRLIMSTHLMQQLIRHPPTIIPLSVDASTSLAYSVSRIAFGDACQAVSYANNLEEPCSSVNRLSVKNKSPTRTRAQGYENAAQDLIGKVTNLEDDLSRLEKSASLLDLRLECQEVEKFATMHRFLKFHLRGGQNGRSDTSANATLSAHKFSGEKYVTAVAMPRNLPETVNCLQL